MKQTSKKRLVIDRETVKALAVELSPDQLRYVDGGAQTNTVTNSSNLACGCLSGISRTS